MPQHDDEIFKNSGILGEGNRLESYQFIQLPQHADFSETKTYSPQCPHCSSRHE